MNGVVFYLEAVFIFSCIMFMVVKVHFLMSLLFLEMMSMMIYFFLNFISSSGDGGVMILFLCMMVLEGAFGLSLVISNSRKCGGDFLTFY